MFKIRNFSVLIVALFFISFNAVSQEFNAGVYGGLVASQLDGDTYAGYNKAGMVGGAYVNRFFNKKWAWQSGLRYIQKGSKRADSEAGVFYKAQLHYMEVPLTVRYQHFKKVDFEAGISLGYLIKATEVFEAGVDPQEAFPEFNKFEAASLIGVNYHFNKNLAAGAFFSYSLMSVRPFTSGTINEVLEKGQHNNLFYFMLAYNFSSWR